MRIKLRGVLITIDAILAVGMLLLAVMLLGTEWFRPLAPDGFYLKQVSLDTLNLMESRGILDSVMNNNESTARDLFEKLPKSVCMQVIITMPTSEEPIATVTRTDCGSYGKELQVVYGNFIYENEIYSVRLESWYRKE